MILNTFGDPKHSCYYLGAKITSLISAEKAIDTNELYNKLNDTDTQQYPYKIFIMTLVWLYAIDIIRYENGGVIKCQ